MEAKGLRLKLKNFGTEHDAKFRQVPSSWGGGLQYKLQAQGFSDGTSTLRHTRDFAKM